MPGARILLVEDNEINQQVALDILQAAGGGAAAHAVADPARIRPLLARLRSLLEESDADAHEVLEQLRPLLTEERFEAVIRRLGDAIEDYDFDLAVEQVAGLEHMLSHDDD